MLVSDLFENVGASTSISTLMSITADMIRTYPKMIEYVHEGFRNHEDPKKYVKFMLGRVRGKWFAENYLSRRHNTGMKNALKTLYNTILKNSVAAGRLANLHVNMDRDIAAKLEVTSSKNFLQLEHFLPQVLMDLSAVSPQNKDGLTQLSNRLSAEITKLYEIYNNYVNQTDLEQSNIEKEEKKKAKSDTGLGQQNSQANDLVNQVLSSLNPKIAHEIRTSIAKQDNKLGALQQELIKRGIKI